MFVVKMVHHPVTNLGRLRSDYINLKASVNNTKLKYITYQFFIQIIYLEAFP